MDAERRISANKFASSGKFLVIIAENGLSGSSWTPRPMHRMRRASACITPSRNDAFAPRYNALIAVSGILQTRAFRPPASDSTHKPVLAVFSPKITFSDGI